MTLIEPVPTIVETPCDPLNPDFGRKSGPEGAEQTVAASEVFKVYPTLMEAGSAELTIEATLPDETDLDVAVYSLTGAKLAGARHPVSSGHNARSLTLPQMPAGMYVVVARTASGSLHKVVRIVRR